MSIVVDVSRVSDVVAQDANLNDRSSTSTEDENIYDKLKKTAQEGDIIRLYELIAEDPNILCHFDKVPFCETPLHIASEKGHTHFAMELMILKPSLASKLNVSGTIPNGLGSLSFLEYINVSHNQLKGEIPQGTQITGQAKSSFEGNAGLCGLPLQETCFGTNAPPTQPPKQEDEEDEEEVLNWKAVIIGYGPGVLLGLAIAQLIASYKPEWLVKIIGPNKRRNC